MESPQELIQVMLYRKPIAIRVVLAFCLTLETCCLASANGGIDLSSPDATIRTYCDVPTRSDLSVIKELFYPSREIEEESFKKPIWTECRIVKKEKTKLVGMDLGSGLIGQQGDVEVITEVRMVDPQKGNPKTKFWYLLRNIAGNWRIISHSHIPDKNYPALD